MVYSRIVFRLWGNNFPVFSKKVHPDNFWHFLALFYNFLAFFVFQHKPAQHKTIQYFLPMAIFSVAYSRITFRFNQATISWLFLKKSATRQLLALCATLALFIIMVCFFHFSAQACWQFNTSFPWPLFQWPTRASHFDYGAARLRVQLKMKGITSYLPTRKKWVLYRAQCLIWH